MRHVYHLVTKKCWEASPAGPYRADSLATEGFIHCSNRGQVAWAANKFYARESDLLVLHLDADRLTSPLKDEDPGIGQTFPHIYGTINREAIVVVEPLQRDAAGQWTFGAGTDK
ncbi:MAG: DUF952 domain-containing protein [Gemmataceae bacterium]|nr:DUF952 domain-containing protein [Gemmataceae bacterium]